MRLTDSEAAEIDRALQALKRSLKDELEGIQEFSGRYKLDNAFLKRIADTYLSNKGLLALLTDAHCIVEETGAPTRCGGVCHCSCAMPGRGYETMS